MCFILSRQASHCKASKEAAASSLVIGWPYGCLCMLRYLLSGFVPGYGMVRGGILLSGVFAIGQ
jgi:hypothetical protein